MKLAVIRFPGSNCDDDARYVLEEILGAEVKMLWHQEQELGKVDAVVLPGGFSYGDYLRSGAMAALSPIMADLKRFADHGGYVLGICNGFQILTEAGLLEGQLARRPQLSFLCDTVTLRVENNRTAFSSDYQEGQLLEIPVAHNDGSYYADQETLARLERNQQIVFRYASKTGELTDSANPNGSLGHIAGIINQKGNVLGMMPHPERASEKLLGSEDGLALFSSLLKNAQGVFA